MNRSRLLVLTTLILVVSGYAFARGEPDTMPSVSLSAASSVYISPNGDGVQDELKLAATLSDAGTTAIKSFTLTVFGSDPEISGQIVWTRREVQEENRGFFGDLLGVGEEPAVAIPDTLTWDGTFLASDLGADGEDAPDGEYIYQLTIVDENGTAFSTPPMRVIVDRDPPSIESVTTNITVFSPNGDGVRDEVSILQDASREVSWSGLIQNESGNTVRTFTWTNDTTRVAADILPPSFDWDGTDAGGTLVDDGRYSYSLTGTDRAGNSTVSTAVNIRVSTRAGDVRLTPSSSQFSPNGDGVKDSLEVATFVTETDGLQSYSVELTSVSDPETVLWSDTGGQPPAELELTGLDSRGRRLADGRYELLFRVSYENGNSVVSEPAEVTIDTVPPSGRINAQTGPEESEIDAPFAFGGTEKQWVDVHVDLSEELDWTAIANLGDTQYRIPISEFGVDTTAFSFRWDGTDPAGNQVPNGTVSLRFDATDAAGNTGRTNQVQAIVDRRSAEVTVAFAGTHFSPDDDGVMDTMLVTMSYTVPDLIDQYLLAISDARGRVIRTEYKRTPFERFEWLGRTNGNTVVPDGEYTASLEVIYYNGNHATARSTPVVVDRTNPEVRRLSAPYRLFSPDGDGERDSVTIEQETSLEDEWIGEIRNDAGNVVYSRSWSGFATSFTWDGTGADGITVPDGDYTYRISADDVSGNVGFEDLTLVVDTRSVPVSQQPPIVWLAVGPIPFTPDGDGSNDRLTITSSAESENTLDRWELVITDPFGAEFRRWSGAGAPRTAITWDGKAPSGELVQSAQEYTARLTVTDENGNVASETAVIAVGILVIRDGLTLRIMIPSIHFAPYTSDLFSVSDEELESNLATLRSLAVVLNRYPDRDILIEGHAAHDYWQEGPRKEREQIEELIPLSAARAEEVRQALIILGVDSDRMSTIGIGGARPIVPHSDRENLWKNRRVEFILERR